MNFRATSKARQWMLWLCAGLVVTAVYVVVSRLVFGSVGWAVFEPHRQRLVLPLVLFLWLFAWETRWDGVEREEVKVKGEGQEGRGEKVEVEDRGREWNLASGSAGQSVDATSSSRQNKDGTSSDRRDGDVASTKEQDHRSSTSTLDSSSQPRPSIPTSSQPQPSTSTSSLSGEELFSRARALQHRQIPDFGHDADYLDLLGASAAKGHAPALAKLGEYAMRRCAWVEAYYWMKLAQRNGMDGLAPKLREIRRNWSRGGFPAQLSNVNQLFTREAGSIGRALLHIDFGREAEKARAFLKANYPELGV